MFVFTVWVWENALESEWALLPGMFTHMRNLIQWQKLHSATEWQWQDIIIFYKNNNIQIYKIDHVQNTIYNIDNYVCKGMIYENWNVNKYVWWINNV